MKTAIRDKKQTLHLCLSRRAIEILDNLSVENGCSRNLVAEIAIHYYEQYLNTLGMLASIPKGGTININGDSIRREMGVYDSTVEKCKIHMRTNPRNKGDVLRLMETVEFHLDHDNCTETERNQFVEYIAWARKRLEDIDRMRSKDDGE